MSSENQMSRYERVKAILEASFGGTSVSYDGHPEFWKLPYDEFLKVEVYGQRLIAPEEVGASPLSAPGAGGAPPAGEPAAPTTKSCCQGSAPPIARRPGRGVGGGGSEPKPPCAGRGARSALVIGLKGQCPFDGTQFPRLPWGQAEPMAASDIQFIEAWIDDCCPETDKPKPECPDQPWQVVCRKDYPVSGKQVNTWRLENGELLVRKNAQNLTEEEKCKWRYVFQELKKLNEFPNDSRSYNSWAQIHGDHCQHGWEQFLPWHRVYLYEFERAIQQIVPDITLPYWEWTNPAYVNGEIPEGRYSGIIPPVYRIWITEQAVDNLKGRVPSQVTTKLKGIASDGTDEALLYNSLWEMMALAGLDWKDYEDEVIYKALVDQLLLVNPVWHPFRYPGMYYKGPTPQSHPVMYNHHYPRKPDIQQIIDLPNWAEFGGGHFANQAFGALSQNPHNMGHIWLGGNNPLYNQQQPPNPATLKTGTFPTLGPLPLWIQPIQGDMLVDLVAVFDPMFWSHHSNVDRVFYEWQKTHSGLAPDDPTDVLVPFGYRVEQALNAEKFGYTYVSDSHQYETDNSEPLAELKTGPVGAKPNVLATHGRAEIRFHSVRRSIGSYGVRVFLNQPGADATTPIVGNDHYVGSFNRFGHGECIGGPGHCCPPPPDPRVRHVRPPRHHNAHHHYRLDATAAVRRMLAKGETDIQINVIAVEPSGRPAEGLKMDGLSLTFFD